MGEVLHGSLLQLVLEHCDFLIIDNSQGSVATRLRCGGIFKYELVANLPVSQPVKEFWKSVNIWEVMGKSLVSCFFLRHSVDLHFIMMLHRVQNNAARIILETVRWFHAIARCWDITLAARSAQDRVQSGSADVQSPQHIDAVVPLSSNPGSTTVSIAIGHYDTVSTFHNDDFCEARLPMLCSGCLELSTKNCR